MNSVESLMKSLELLAKEPSTQTDESLAFPIVKSPSKSEVGTKALLSERIGRRPKLTSKDDLIIAREAAVAQKHIRAN